MGEPTGHRMTWLDRGIRAIMKCGETAGLMLSLLSVIVWVGIGATVARTGIEALSRYPRLEIVFLVLVATLTALGGLVGFWTVADLVAYRKRGCRIRWIEGNNWVYEERRPGGSVEALLFSREIIGDGYPAPCEVYLSSEARWALQVPQWAHDKR